MSSVHFISGLPRSGSTLLAALLRQNPRFEAGMSGPLAGLFVGGNYQLNRIVLGAEGEWQWSNPLRRSWRDTSTTPHIPL